MTSVKRSLWPKVLLAGDSLCQYSFSVSGGWGALLADSLQRQCDVVCRGFSGYSSRQWVGVARSLPPACFTAVVAVLWLGANDACDSTQQGVPVEEYKKNLATIVQLLQSRCGVSKFLLMTPPPADEKLMSPELAEGRSGAKTAQYAAACVEVACSLDLPCVDLHKGFKKERDLESLLSDGLHLSAKGAGVVHRELLPLLQVVLAPYRPLNMEDEQLVLPLWRDLSCVDPAAGIDKWLKLHSTE